MLTYQNLKSAILTICCAVAALISVEAQVVINEYSASNLHFHQDGYGDYSDYIELYNTSASPVDLSGYHLSENLNDPTKWQIPAGVVIPANGYELFYLSAKLTTQFDGQHYHLPFQITQTEPEEVVFADPAGVVIDSVAVTLATQMDHSRGRTTDGGPDWGVMTQPTPNASNANVYDSYTEKPVFNLAPGFYTGSQVVSISITDPTHEIRYTTNGTKPTWTSTLYTGPLTINNTVTIRARSFPIGGSGGSTSPPYCDEGQGSAGFPNDQDCENAVCANDAFCCNNTWDNICASDAINYPECNDCLSTYVPPPPSGQNVFPGFTETNTYFINETFSMQTIAMSGQLGQWNAGGGGGWNNINGNWFNYYEVCLEYFDENGVCQDELEGMLRQHGNDSWAFPQRGMRFHSRDQMGFDNNIEHQLFPHSNRDHFDVLIMKAGGSDNYPGNGWLPSAHLRDGFAQTASQRGELELDERSYNHHIKFMNGEYWGLYEMRERIDKDFTEYYYDQEEEYVDMLEYWGGMTEEYGNDNDWVLLYNFVTGNDMSVQLNYDYVTTQLNPESFIDNFVLNTYFVNTDWLNWNTKWWRGTQPATPGVRWRYSLWDLDNTFNLGQNYTGWSSTGPYVNVICEATQIFQNWGSNNGHTEMYSSLLENDGFFEAYISRYSDLLNTALHCDTLVAILDEFEARMLPEMPRQVNRWGGSVAQWQNRIQNIRDFICIRWNVVNQQIIDCFEDDHDISGPYEITVVIVGPGNVELNTITISSGPWTGTYFGGLNLNLNAVPLTNGEFIEWSLNGNYTGQDLLNMNLPITPLNQNDTIFAYFNFVDPLPVEWLSFDGEVINRWGELDWRTASETNSSHFEVQRSSDAEEFFPVGEVNAAGNSSTPNGYAFTDQSQPEGIQYYRLKQIDFNGDFQYSNTIALDYGRTASALLVSPNPNTGRFNVVNQTDRIIKAELLSPHSQYIRTVTFEAYQTTKLNLEDMSSGIYLLRYLQDGQHYYHKVAIH